MEALKVDTTPTKSVMVESLTRDASVQACIYDLIDNSIDAARTQLQKNSPESIDAYGQPASYAGYTIEVTVSESGVQICDNCGGITPDDIAKLALKFGGTSDKNFGIGLYGVGLKRAIFKLGDDIRIESVTGHSKVELVFSVSDYLESEAWELPASVYPCEARSGTLVEISSPSSGVQHVIGNSETVKEMKEQLSQLYYLFLQKGLSLHFNGVKLDPVYVEIREDSPFPLLTDVVPFGEDVSIKLIAGQHINHRFTAEQDYTKNHNAHYTKDYGWNIICNDRPVVLRNRESLTGWMGSFHTEFYGFVGYVRFYSREAGLLPWNTSKTSVDQSNKAYQKALEAMSKLAKSWRAYSRIAKEAKKRKEPLLPRSEQRTPIVPDPNQLKPAPKKPKSQPQQRIKKFLAILPQDLDVSKCSPKLCDIIEEAQAINILRNRYVSAALMRMLFEISVLDYLLANKKMGKLYNYIFAQRNEKREKEGLAPKRYKQSQVTPDLKDICAFLHKYPGEWGGYSQNYIKKSLADFVNRKGELNAALHNPRKRVGTDKILGIRDELLPIFIHFIEHAGRDLEEEE